MTLRRTCSSAGWTRRPPWLARRKQWISEYGGGGRLSNGRLRPRAVGAVQGRLSDSPDLAEHPQGVGQHPRSRSASLKQGRTTVRAGRARTGREPAPGPSALRCWLVLCPDGAAASASAVTSLTPSQLSVGGVGARKGDPGESPPLRVVPGPIRSGVREPSLAYTPRRRRAPATRLAAPSPSRARAANSIGTDAAPATGWPGETSLGDSRRRRRRHDVRRSRQVERRRRPMRYTRFCAVRPTSHSPLFTP
jgi:hypothetical protein